MTSVDLLNRDTAAAVHDLVAGSDLSKSEVCRRSGLSRALLDDYLNGRKTPSLRQLQRVAAAVGLRLELRSGQPIRRVSDEYVAAMRLAGTLSRGRDSQSGQQLRFPHQVWAAFRTPAVRPGRAGQGR